MRCTIVVIVILFLLLTGNTHAQINPAREIEPNNDITSATQISVGGGEVRGQLSGDTDIDYFVFSSTGGVVNFTIRPDTSSYDGTSLSASILAADGTVITSNDIKSDSVTVNLAASTTSGIYYLLFNRRVSYTVMRKDYVINSVYDPTSKREIEPNNDITSATQISVGGGEVRGQLSGDTDIDYFVFSSTGGVVNFTIRPDTSSYDGTSLSASILAADGTVITSNDIKSDSVTVNLAASTTSGIYYLLFNRSVSYTVMRRDYVITQPAITGILNGMCGTANTTSLIVAPNNNLCTFGIVSSVTGTGPWIWTCTGINGGTTATCNANILQQTTLKAGWNLMGWTTNVGYYQGTTAPLSTEQASSATMSSNTMSTVFTTMGLSSTDSFVVVGPDGVVYMPGSPFNTLKKTLPGKAYWIYTPSDKTITVPGSALLPTDQLPLSSGWNQIAYWGTDGVAPATGFNCISGKYDILVDETGKVYMSGSPFNTLKTLQKNKGYFIHTTTPATLVYQCQ
jgi:hypothetical protein